MVNKVSGKYYIALISIHGLIRGDNLELGRDADTGGQTKYVVELARALSKHPSVERVDLLTRLVIDKKVSDDYCVHEEHLAGEARIVRIVCGPEGYIAKEELWDNLDSFADNAQRYLSAQVRRPDIIHSHYADAGYVGTKLAHQLGIPLIFTGHSLGRTKRRRLLANGWRGDKIEKRYNMSRRIEAEETTLSVAERVITSTNQEIEQQYAIYDYYQPDQMRVIPPGTDIEKFIAPDGSEFESDLFKDMCRFLHDPKRPVILALSRPDQRKNILTLIEAYGESDELKQHANLLIVAGNRQDIREMDYGSQEVLTDMLLVIDQYDLYGKVAYPKSHHPDDVPLFYRITALTKGVFVNPALTEPFGLTLIEAAASGLPIVATDDGGPVDIIKNCRNGYLIDPLDKKEISLTLLKILQDDSKWQTLAENGFKNVNRYYSWQSHVDKYISAIAPVIEKSEPLKRMEFKRRPMLYHDRAIVSDLDLSLTGDQKLLTKFTRLIKENQSCVTFGIATGRRLDSALMMLRRHGIPRPNVLFTSLGTDIYYAPNLSKDTAWSEHIDYQWNPRAVRRVLADIPGIILQPKEEQSLFKLSYYIDPPIAPDLDTLNQILLQGDQTVNVMISFGKFLDIIPLRASKGMALRWFADQWDIPLNHILAVGGSGADEDMLRGNTLAVVVANRHNEELSELTDIERIYFSKSPYAGGIIEAIEHYNFFDICKRSQP